MLDSNGIRGENSNASCKTWLRVNGFIKELNWIIKIEAMWKMRGVKTHRNWWYILAGTPKGSGRRVAGYTFPVLFYPRRREGLCITPNAVKKESTFMLPRAKKATRRWHREAFSGRK